MYLDASIYVHLRYLDLCNSQVINDANPSQFLSVTTVQCSLIWNINRHSRPSKDRDTKLALIECNLFLMITNGITTPFELSCKYSSGVPTTNGRIGNVMHFVCHSLK